MRGSRLAEGAATLGTPGSPPGRTPSPAPIVLDAHALDGKTMDERKSIDDACDRSPTTRITESAPDSAVVSRLPTRNESVNPFPQTAGPGRKRDKTYGDRMGGRGF